MVRAAAAVFFLLQCGCDLIGPSCLGRQQTGAVASFSGEATAGQLAVHRVPYGTNGSQNDVHVSWGNPETLGSPPEFKLWVVGDPDRGSTYSVSTTWFFGPDC